MQTLSLDLQTIKQEYFFLADYGKDMQGTYITNLHPQAFAKKDIAVLPLTYLLAFFVFRCENFTPITPKDEFGMVLLDIADLYAQNKNPTQEQISEAITAILLEFVRFNADYNKALYSIICDFVSMPSENSPHRGMVERGIIPNPKQADDDSLTRKPKSNYAKLNEAIQHGEFKNSQVRDRAIAVYKYLHNCEPTEDDLKMQISEEDKERIMTEQEMPFDLTPRQYAREIASGI